MPNNVNDFDVFSPNQFEGVYYEAPIVANRAPNVRDKYEIGKVWIDKNGDDAYFLTNVTGGSAVWVNAGGGAGTFASLTATTGNITADAGDIIATLGDLSIISGTITFGAFSTGVVFSDAVGLLSYATGTNGQVIIGGTGVAPIFAALTAGAGINITNASNAITITATGAVASTFPCDGGTATPAAGATTIAGGSNITTAGAGATVTIDLDASPSVAGSLTAGVDLNMLTGTCTITSNTNGAEAIYLHTDAGTSEQISIRVDQGTAVNSLNIASDVGGVTVFSGLASADAINIDASDAAGGIDVDFGTGGLSMVGANGAINLESGTAAINVGADAAVHTVTVGSVTGGASTVLQAGTGNLVATSTDAVTIDAAGVLELNSSAGIISVGNDAVAQNINVGTGAAARTITIGNNTGATAVVLNSGTGGIDIDSTGAGDITINSDDTVLIDADGVLELNSSAGVIGIGSDADAQNINIGTGAAARVITMGNVTGATQVVLDCGTAGVSVGASATAHTTTLGGTTGASALTAQTGTGAMTFTSGGIFDVNSTGAVTVDSTGGTIAIGAGADNNAITIGAAGERTTTIGNNTGASSVVCQVGTGPAYFGANATAHLSILGSTTGASATTVQAGTGDFTITAGGILDVNVTDALTMDSTAGAISIGAGADAFAMNLGTGAAARTITVGNVTGATQVDINTGTGGLNVATTGAGDIILDSDDTVLIDADGVLELNSSAGAIGIGTDADAQAINIGTGAAARTITVGNATAGTAIQLTAGDDSAIEMTPVTDSQAAATSTLNGNVGVGTFTGLTTASAAAQVFTITNTTCTVGSAILCSMSNLGGNDAQMTVTRITPGAGSFTVTGTNSGAAALNGDVIITFWIVAA